MKFKLRFATAAIAIFMFLTAASAGVSAAAFYVGQSLGIGKVTKAATSQIAAGVTYDEAYIEDNSDNDQHVQALTFNPADGKYVPIVYSKYSGYGATTLDNAKAAEADGYDVKGGVNGSFFSLTGSSANIYGGVTITDGRILQGNNSHSRTWVLAMNSDGSTALVESKLSYSLAAGNGVLSASIECINICPDTTYDVIYYYDDLCGTGTDTKAAGVEIVFEKQNNSELTVGGTLVGEVAEVRKNVSSGGKIGEGRFVLYAPDTSTYAESLRKLKIGDLAEITVTETVKESRSVMENCSSAVVTYGYHIVKNGKNITSSNGLGESFNTARAQRTGLGIKADGSMVFVVSDGRSEDYPGLTVYELADLLISMGCVTAINFDGGYSTQMVTEAGDGTIKEKTEQLRRVANSILIVKRPVVSAELKKTLADLIAEVKMLFMTFELAGDTDGLNEEMNNAISLGSVSTAMDGDYTKAIMRLRAAMDNVTKVAYRTGIYKLNGESYIFDSASGTAGELVKVPKGESLTVTEISGNYGYTKYLGYYGWIDLTDTTIAGTAAIESAVIQAPSVVYRGGSVKISWNPVPGASGYTYKVIELTGEPGGANESDGAAVLAEAWTTDHLGVTIPGTSRTDGKYIKVAVCVEYPTGSAWSSAYITTSLLPFTDVSVTHWGYNGVVYAYENDLFKGVTDTRFDPNGTMTRAMMATVVYRMAGSPELDANIKTTFKDVDESSWYYKGVVWCQSQGIVTGISDTKFDPDGFVTREQTACFLYRLAKYAGYDVSVKDKTVTSSFSDAEKIGSYAEEAMAWIVENGIMQGSGNKLSPKDTADRVQIVTLISNFCGAFDVR